MSKRDSSVHSNTLVTVVSSLKSSEELTDDEIAAAMSVACGSSFIPCDIFTDRKLGPLECIVRHLREKQKMSFHEIAVLLNRDDRTIWVTYHNAQKKTAGEDR